jgi:NarL family two-component system response regulator LiaR
MGASPPIRVILIDDHSWVHEIVARVLEAHEDIQLVAQGSTGQEAIQLCEIYQPNLILMDVVMPRMGGIEATKLLHQKYPQIKILVLSSFQDEDSVRTMLENGAMGYVLKGALMEDLADVIRATYVGKVVLSDEVSHVLLTTSTSTKKQDFGLTRRELEVLQLMAGGLTNGQIATKLVISESTVKFHISNVIYKMGVETRAEAIVIAAKNNLV